ncbi:ammonium transporter [Rhodococcus sp. D2-41]|uniref:ammonium transporter n=1 Tax=Speluncibacter jeojiensis TaxID=2710754 RepID=UPI00241024E5|nr:ammonium transporter [Rhodococcus sp. D2-41]MDG3011018.1 ammonium transporter [Rhodococcus sp. D2-41]
MGVPNAGDTAWLLVSAAMVLLMTPGLAFFYGGMVRAKSVLNMIMMSFGALGVVGLLWVLFGYSMVFGEDKANLIGDPFQFFGLHGLMSPNGSGPAGVAVGAAAQVPLVGTVPATVFVIFEMMFAVITVALVSGAVADRMRFGPWMVFAGLWATLVYFPVAHWVFSIDGLNAVSGGWIANKLHTIDFAGGTAVEINSGIAALVLALVLGKRRGWRRESMRPHNMPLVMIGAGLLWFGWYGFNAGSAFRADGAAGTTMVTTTVAACAAMIAWLIVERFRDGHATSLGAASGAVAGLVAITPSCSAVNVLGATVIGVAAGAICALAISLKYRFGYDDSLDVVGVHLVGGIVGTLLIGLVAAPESPAGVAGLFYGGGFDQLWRQAVGAGAVLLYSLVVTAIIAYAIKFTMGLRASREHEVVGLDEMQHAESAYDFGGLGGGSVTSRSLSMSRGDEPDGRSVHVS